MSELNLEKPVRATFDYNNLTNSEYDEFSSFSSARRPNLTAREMVALLNHHNMTSERVGVEMLDRIFAKAVLPHRDPRILVPLDLPGSNHSCTQEDCVRYVQSWTDEYRQQVNALSKQCAPMYRNNRLSICIPVAARDEIPFIKRTVECFTNQSLARDSFELLFLLNATYETYADGRDTFEKLSKMIKGSSTDIQTNVMSTVIDSPELVSIGHLRSMVHDVALLRSIDRGSEREHYMFRCDADVRAMHPRSLETFIRKLDARCHVDSVMGRLHWSFERALENPLFFLHIAFDEIANKIGRRFEDRLSHCGPNFVVRTNVYAALAGYESSWKFGEDIKFHERHRSFREGSTSHVQAIDGGVMTRLRTSTRRSELAFLSGDPSVRQWQNELERFDHSNPKARDIGKNLSTNFNETMIRTLIEEAINLSLGSYRLYSKGSDPSAQMIVRALWDFLGVEAMATDDGIAVVSTDRFMNRFKSLREDQGLNLVR